mgnify:CR=1 FL=1
MNYARIYRADIANGPGFRCSLFCTGCKRKCPGCWNKEAQDPDFGKPFDEDAKKKIFKELSEPTCDGISFLGGEPLSVCSDNRKQTIQLAKECRERFPNKTQWLWSGYTFEEISADPSMRDILNYIDVLVDGEFRMDERDLSCAFKGSRNQRIISVSDWRKTGKIVELYDSESKKS